MKTALSRAWMILVIGAVSGAGCRDQMSPNEALVAGSVGRVSRLRWKFLDAGFYATCGMTERNGAYCWGEGTFGELGDGRLTSSTRPVHVLDYTSPALPSTTTFDRWGDFVDLQAGTLSTCGTAKGVDPSGSALPALTLCWGTGYFGDLGNGSTASLNPHPFPVEGPDAYHPLTMGWAATCGGRSLPGQWSCWGDNSWGALAIGPAFGAFLSPTASTWNGQTMVVGPTHGCGLQFPTRSGGTAYCWGDNSRGQIGNGTTTGDNSLTARRWFATPVATSILFTQLAAGVYFTCGISVTQDLYCWGANDFGKLGIGRADAEDSTPQWVTPGTKYQFVTAGQHFACAILARPARDGNGVCWGLNAFGALGRPGAASSATPAPIAGGLQWDQLSADLDHVCGISKGVAYCWGSNQWGKAGIGVDDATQFSVEVPTMVADPLPELASSAAAPMVPVPDARALQAAQTLLRHPETREY